MRAICCCPVAGAPFRETPNWRRKDEGRLSAPGQGGPDGDDEDDGLEEPLCRICYEGEKAGKLLSLCHCKGSMGCTHLRCLERWLDAAQKTRCELCGFSYRVQLTRRYSVLPSVRVWIREQADKRLLVIDLLTVICVMPVIGAYVYFSVRGILELAKGPVGIGPNETTTEALTAIGLLVMCAIIVICFFIWLGIACAADTGRRGPGDSGSERLLSGANLSTWSAHPAARKRLTAGTGGEPKAAIGG
ncbi:E3 ubiquitin-protein ligase MARCHF3-like [Schistocerca americana]|uniref:E3 ubiquitin-protein ligase MARCHF3-like n=1 Tax=Schistocerca americana TaxID=7009 RepID=UPI001F4F7004|nr:E3 ubiquitin-protein ligase MARCHF3-like [Schistocerca americana]